MNGQRHIISKQVLELTIPGRERAIPIQNEASEIVKQKLQPALDTLFSKIAGQEKIIRIDKLVIDLGTISEKDMGNMLVERTVEQVEDKIVSLLKTGNKATSGTSKTPENVKVISKSKDVLEQLVIFLRTGHFSWWHIQSDSHTLEGIFAEVLKYDIKDLKDVLVPVTKEPSVRQRLVFQFDHAQLDALLKKIYSEDYESYSVVFQGILSFSVSAQFKKVLQDTYYEVVFQYFSQEQKLSSEDQKINFIKSILDLSLSKQSDNEKETVLSEMLSMAQLNQLKVIEKDKLRIIAAIIQVAIELPSPNQAFKKTIQNIPEKNEAAINKLLKQFAEKIKKDSVGKIERAKEELRKESVKTALKKKPEAKDKVEEQGNVEDQDKIKNPDKVKDQDKALSIFPPRPSIDAEEIFINNAGMVLLHPFLRYFFEGSNLLDKELQFKNKSDAFKAVHLLQFIVTEQESTMEADLPLNKILCGLDAIEPVPISWSLSDEEKKECLYLTKTVLERWEALKTSNPVALRETYLQREGILKQSGQSWTLSIERNTFDVMLEKLPWSISLISLPWSPQILYVEW